MSVSGTAESMLVDVRLAEAPLWQRWYLRNERLLLGLAGFVSVLIVWDLAVRLGYLRVTFVSSPSRIFDAARLEVSQGRIWGDIGVSLLEFGLGYAAAAVLGISIGFVAGWFRRANYIIDPWLAALYATPDVALVPLIILWLGIGLWSKVFVVFLTSLFAVAINTLVGVQSTEARFLEVAHSFGASRARVFRTVVLPSTVPFILTGLRLASGRALVGVVLAELIAANQGIGFMISVSGSTLNTARLMVGVILLGAFGVLLGEVMRRVERRFDAWRPQMGDGR
ncbi:MAG TPA: ABC transporter permease [Chloroflexota bacterium]|nr:ABC transporter permease [Chloroflexota bacterium]